MPNPKLKDALVEEIRKRKALFFQLEDALEGALERASFGKGWQRHGENAPFQEQDIVRECRTFGINPNLFQIRKKAKELRSFPVDKQIAELQDIIVYAAATIIHLTNSNKEGGE